MHKILNTLISLVILLLVIFAWNNYLSMFEIWVDARGECIKAKDKGQLIQCPSKEELKTMRYIETVVYKP